MTSGAKIALGEVARSVVGRSVGLSAIAIDLGGFDRGTATGLSIRHDHGGAEMSDEFRRELAFPGIVGSPGFVREPEGHGVEERFVRTRKEDLLSVPHFATIAELVEALRALERRYDGRWRIERRGFCEPDRARVEASERT